MDNNKVNYIKAILAFVVFILIIYFLVYPKLDAGDNDTSAAFVCLASVAACMVSFKISDLGVFKKTFIAISVIGILVLLYVYNESLSFSGEFEFGDLIGYESGNIAAMIPIMGLIFYAFYKKICKNLEEYDQDQE